MSEFSSFIAGASASRYYCPVLLSPFFFFVTQENPGLLIFIIRLIKPSAVVIGATNGGEMSITVICTIATATINNSRTDTGINFTSA
ncbi:hypothetical protein SGGMMB4_01465 [Sodalis glossinidius str. 'morsitans']|uniref:Uncharacterized protein n=1 Tax=Sodalis glossinidius (strain morsitans) TaxID=343509 RepID=A0A193QGU5_SODGM|nr:hypothetical protein SGGMMB4_01465 [Sodalis glossinidius str. 'morsitans']